MLLTITTTHQPATDLGYLLHKNPHKCQSFDYSYGTLHVFFPEATAEKCTAAMMLDFDSVELVRSSRHVNQLLEQYVNDRPYVASSFMSVAIGQVFGSALNGQCKEKPELVNVPMPFIAKIAVLPCSGREPFLRKLFEPLGYIVKAKGYPLESQFPEWGNSPYFTVELEKVTTLKELLMHLYVLIPVMDNQKHYFVTDEEVDKLLKHGEGWLANHPARDAITRRYLKQRGSLVREAISRLNEENPLAEDEGIPAVATETVIEKKLNLNEERLDAVLAAVKSSGATAVLDLGCGEGSLLKMLLKDKSFQKVTGMDVSIRALEIASERLRLEQMPIKQRDRLQLLHGSLMYRDKRLDGYDAAAVVEVIEHLDAPRLRSFERVLFEYAKPKTIVLTTPNREYNVTFEGLGATKLRHPDHRFEWTRREFEDWAAAIDEKFGYTVTHTPVGTITAEYGAPTQMAVFTRREEQG